MLSVLAIFRHEWVSVQRELCLGMYVGVSLDEKEDEKLKQKNKDTALLVPVSDTLSKFENKEEKNTHSIINKHLWTV